MPADLETIVQRMIEAGEAEANIAGVTREYRSETQPAEDSNGGVAGILVPVAALATRAIAPIAEAAGAFLLAVRAISTGAGAAIHAVLTAAAHAAGIPGAITGPALALGEVQAGKLGAASSRRLARPQRTGQHAWSQRFGHLSEGAYHLPADADGR